MNRSVEAAKRGPDDEGEWQGNPGIKVQAADNHGAIGADGQPRSMREIDDLQNAEYGEQSRRDDEQDRRRRDNIQDQCHGTLPAGETEGTAGAEPSVSSAQCQRLGHCLPESTFGKELDHLDRAVRLHLAHIHGQRGVVFLVHRDGAARAGEGDLAQRLFDRGGSSSSPPFRRLPCRDRPHHTPGPRGRWGYAARNRTAWSSRRETPCWRRSGCWSDRRRQYRCRRHRFPCFSRYLRRARGWHREA